MERILGECEYKENKLILQEGFWKICELFFLFVVVVVGGDFLPIRVGLGFRVGVLAAGGGQGEEEEEGWVGRTVVRSVMNGSQAQQERGWCVCWKTYFVGVGFSEKSLYRFVIYCRSCCKKKKKKKIAARRNWHGMNTMGCS